MPWVRLDDHFPDHDKLAHCGDYAPLCGWLFVCALAYCNRQLTDGRIPKPHVHKLTNFRHLHVETASVGRGANKLAAFSDEVEVDRLAQILVDVGLWEDDGHYYLIHDYLDYQPSRDEVAREKAWRQAAGRKGGQHRQASAKANTQADALAFSKPVPVPVPKDLKDHPAGAGNPHRKLVVADADGPPNSKLLAKIATDLLDCDPSLDGADLKEALKRECGRLHVSYNSRTINKALDGVQAYRAKEAG